MTVYFDTCACSEDVKSLYHKLAVQYHPDNNPDIDTKKIMRDINAEFEKAFARLKNIHRNVSGETYTTTKDTNETADDFREIIDAIIHFVNCKIEIIGSWIWVSGETKPYKEILKELSFHWSSNKKAWAYHETPFRKRHNRNFSMDDLRNKFGSEEVEPRPRAALS